jgi:hypothetical protein
MRSWRRSLLPWCAAPGHSEPVDETFLHEVVRRAPRLTSNFVVRAKAELTMSRDEIIDLLAYEHNAPPACTGAYHGSAIVPVKPPKFQTEALAPLAAAAGAGMFLVTTLL